MAFQTLEWHCLESGTLSTVAILGSKGYGLGLQPSFYYLKTKQVHDLITAGETEVSQQLHQPAALSDEDKHVTVAYVASHLLMHHCQSGHEDHWETIVLHQKVWNWKKQDLHVG